ncbi:unnamed protein product [Symbiodinium necroappetens]|uniref:Uncharacterized protein n=1 Tax=Symbiodinium necroappetens TaxID=1628268 RepID=A0A812UZW6_9DINO|nr:unnamed protein product [Symbiodinium necroappetens]
MDQILSATYADIDVTSKIRERCEQQKHLGRVFFKDFVPDLVEDDPRPGVRKFLMVQFQDGTQTTCGDGDGFEWIHDKALHESIVGRTYEHHEYIAKAIYASGDHPAPQVDVTNKVRTLFDDAGAKSTDVFKLSDFNSHFGNPNPDASKMLEITLQDGRVFFYDEDEECALPHGRPKTDNTSHLRWQKFGEEKVMSEAELLETLRGAGITYDSKYRVCDKNPVGAIQEFCKKHGKVFRCPWYNFVDHDDWQWRKLYWARPRQINPEAVLFLDGCNVTDTRQEPLSAQGGLEVCCFSG